MSQLTDFVWDEVEKCINLMRYFYNTLGIKSWLENNLSEVYKIYKYYSRSVFCLVYEADTHAAYAWQVSADDPDTDIIMDSDVSQLDMHNAIHAAY